jgi:60 kDa SS-A/Ro ribonucleoprotein
MRADQVENEAGGYVWEADKWSRLRRFLILGTEGGSYYVGEQKLTTKNVEALRLCLVEDGLRTVQEIVEISEGGRAPKNDQALFALAYAISHGDNKTKSAAAEALPRVARIGTHLYSFVAYAETMRGWGRTMRWAVSNWYDRHPQQLAYQAIKYRNREGWSHRDLLRLAHPSAQLEAAPVFEWIVRNEKTTPPDSSPVASTPTDIPLLGAFQEAQASDSPKRTAELVREFRLPREALKTEHLKSVEVWQALLEAGMPMTALIRNLATMTRNETLDSTEHLTLVLDQLGDTEYIRKSRVHPLGILIAMRTYASGRGYMSRGEGWNPKPKITDALDAAFYTAFGNVAPTNKKLLLAVDVSGSMEDGQVGGSPLTPREAGVAMALVTLSVEPDVEVVGFDTSVYSTSLSSRQRLDDAMSAFPRTGNGTDTALPIMYAMQYNKQFEGFVSFTDHQTWYGRQMHPAQAMVEYRKKSGINARNVTVTMVAYDTQTTDPLDAGSLDVVGFDTATPGLISEFVSGTI